MSISTTFFCDIHKDILPDYRQYRQIKCTINITFDGSVFYCLSLGRNK